MHDTGPRGPASGERPIAELLGSARDAWEACGDVPALRRGLVELLLRLESEEGSRHG
jgi:hypothetical protein